jgi:hypothetical protein
MPRQRNQKVAAMEQAIQEAFHGVASGEYKSLKAAALKLNFPASTLYHRRNGRVSRSESCEDLQLLTFAEEAALVKWISHLTANGLPPWHPFVRKMAEEIRRQRISQINSPFVEYVTYPSLGKEWVTCCLHRHPHLQTAINQSISHI